MKLPNFVNPSADSSPKIGHDFSNKGIQKWKLSKNSFNKKCAPKLVLLIKKNIGKIRMNFDIENSLWKSDFDTFWRPVSGWILKGQ